MAAPVILKTALAGVAGVATCKIGMEANISPDDYPMVRLVPSVVRNGPYLGRQCDLTIYFGQPIHEFTDGLESLYASLFALESEIMVAVRATGLNAAYDETVLDEDRLEAYKIMALRFLVTG